MNKIATSLILLLGLTAAALCRQQKPTPRPTPDDDVVKISTALIQVDVTVTDSKGRPITDLKPDEVQIYENGQKQEITTFSFLNFETRTIEKTKAAREDPRSAPSAPVPPVKLTPGQVARTIALVVDDLGLSFESTAKVQQSLRKFVDEQMQPGDLVAIVRTSSGVGALQQFTSDKRLLYAAIKRVKWNALSGKVGAFAPMGQPSTVTLPGSEKDQGGPGASRLASDAAQIRSDFFTVGTLGAVNFVVNGMRPLPGRKSIILFSDGLSLMAKDPNFKTMNTKVMDALRLLSDKANRAGVVIYSIDARGLVPLGLSAEDSTGSLAVTDDTGDLVADALDERRSDFFESLQGLEALSRSTGGFLIKNNNDINQGIDKVLGDQKGFYLIGYQPDDETFDPKKNRYNRLTVKVSREGARVRYRSGFFGIKDEDVNEQKDSVTASNGQQLLEALFSPFSAQDISVKLTPLFASEPQHGSFINTLLHVDVSGLQFSDEPDGKKKAVFNILIGAFGDGGLVAGSVGATQTLNVDAKEMERLLKRGVNYAMTFPVKSSGAYQLRVALRDKGNGAIGSANQFVEVPEMKKERAVLSGIILQKKNAETLSRQEERYLHDAALREFAPGVVLTYALVVYNPAIEKTTRKPNVTVQAKIFRENREIYAGPSKDYVFQPGTSPGALPVTGALQIPVGMEPGEYVLQVIVTDLAANEKYRYTSQWLDFEIVK